MKKLIVDRIEEKQVILEDDDLNVIVIPIDKFGFIIKEKDIVIEDENGNYVLDTNSTNKRKDYIEEITKDLWEN